MKKLAINGGEPTIKKEFPAWPVWDELELQSVKEVIESSVWGVDGQKLVEFAEKFAAFQHVQYALPIANGSVAIEVALEALKIGEGDEVIVPDYTFMATAVAPIRRGARLVLVDVNPDTFCIDPQHIQEAITDKTKAILPVHFGGHPCDMESIMTIAEKYALHVIEDCAHAHGAIWDGRYVGSFGDAGTFSLQSSKTLCCGEGGAIVTNSERLFGICRSISNCGRAVGEPDYNHYINSTNYRLGELQAGLLLGQMTRLEAQCTKRDHNGKILTGLLEQIDGIKPQARDPKLGRHGHYLFTFLLENDIPREPFNKAIEAEGVPIQLEYPAVHTLEFIKKKKLGEGEFPVSEHIANRSVWLYHHALLGTEEEVSLIAEAIKKVIEHKNELTSIE